MSAQNSDKTAKRVRGRPFVKGQVANPGGRPKIPEPFKQHVHEAVDKIIELMGSNNQKIALQAASLVAAYALGKPTEHHEINGTMTLEHVLGSA